MFSAPLLIVVPHAVLDLELREESAQIAQLYDKTARSARIKITALPVWMTSTLISKGTVRTANHSSLTALNAKTMPLA